MALNSPRAAFEDPPATQQWDFSDHNRMLQQLAETVDSILEGLVPWVGQVTLDANDTETTLTDDRIGPQSKVFFSPTTANAQAIAVPRVSAGRGTATLTHANDANTDKTFDYIVVGI